MHTVLVPPLLCSSALYAPILDTAWSCGSVTVADTRHDDTIAGMAGRLLHSVSGAFTLIGTSMGGYVALEVMRQAPERVMGLGLVSTSAHADSDVQLAARQRQSQLVREGRFGELVDAAFPGIVAARNESDPALLRAWRDMAAVVGPEAFLRQQAAVMARMDTSGLLTGIRCPTLVMHGVEDRLIPVQAGLETAQEVPTATLHLVEQAGHFLFLEQPEEASGTVDAFLKTIAQSTDQAKSQDY